MKLKKGTRVEYTWPGLGEGPKTKQGTVTVAHRSGSVTILFDGEYRPQFWQSVELLREPTK